MTDSSVAHLASSLGRPVWNLLPYHAYWLYLSGRDDCPRYPSMRLIRQPKPGDWDTMFRKAAARLKIRSRLPRNDASLLTPHNSVVAATSQRPDASMRIAT